MFGMITFKDVSTRNASTDVFENNATKECKGMHIKCVCKKCIKRMHLDMFR